MCEVSGKDSVNASQPPFKLADGICGFWCYWAMTTSICLEHNSGKRKVEKVKIQTILGCGAIQGNVLPSTQTPHHRPGRPR